MTISKVTVANSKNGDMTGVAKALRNMAEATANGGKNWDNYEQIALQIVQQIYQAGTKA